MLWLIECDDFLDVLFSLYCTRVDDEKSGWLGSIGFHIHLVWKFENVSKLGESVI